MSTTSERLMGGPRAGRSVVPTASSPVKVKSDDRIEGVRLSAVATTDPGGTTAVTGAGVPSTTANAEDEALLLRFSPDFIVFPDATADASPPFKDGRNDYHPRSVEAFLDGARPYMATPGGLLRGCTVAAVAILATGIGALLLLVAVVRFDAVGALSWLLVINAAAALVPLGDPRPGGTRDHAGAPGQGCPGRGRVPPRDPPLRGRPARHDLGQLGLGRLQEAGRLLGGVSPDGLRPGRAEGR